MQLSWITGQDCHRIVQRNADGHRLGADTCAPSRGARTVLVVEPFLLHLVPEGTSRLGSRLWALLLARLLPARGNVSTL